MKVESALMRDADGALWLQKPPRPPRRVVTVAQACRRLRRSRRQLYRLMGASRLGPLEKMLGEWLLDSAAVEALADAPLAAQRLPARLKPLFPEYALEVLNAGKDGDFVIARVLEGGGRRELRWLLERYSTRQIQAAIEREGNRLLSERSRRLWSLVFKATPRPLPGWRQADPWQAGRA